MPHFAGLGAGAGWHKFLFVITPDEMRTVLTAHALTLLDQNWDSGTLTERSMSSYLEAYEAYFQAFLVPSPDRRHSPSGIRAAVVASFLLEHQQDFQGPRLLSAPPYQPPASLGEFEIWFDGKALRTFVVADRAFFGLELSFPKVIFDTGQPSQTPSETAGCHNHAMYGTVRKHVLSLTKPCVLQSPARTHKTRIRVSGNAKSHLASHWYLKEKSLTLL